MSREKNGSRGTVKAVIYLLIVVILAGMVVYLTQSLRRDREPEITGTFIDSKLEAAGELTSAKMIYNGLIHYSDGSIPFLTQKAFNMTYRAEVRAGVDLSKANTEVTDSEVTVTLPAVEIFDISIDNDSIQYYDEKAALLNWERKEDGCNRECERGCRAADERNGRPGNDGTGTGENTDYRNAVRDGRGQDIGCKI